MDTLTLARYEAQGNDFLIALLTERERLNLDASLKVQGLERTDLARVVCDRHIGIGSRPGHLHSRGADGFIIGVDRRPQDCVRMHLLNSDGSSAETSGNGLACLALASFHQKIIGPGPLERFVTDAGEQYCTIGERSSSTTPVADDDAPRFVEVSMNQVRPGPALPTELADLLRDNHGENLANFCTGDVGNPHLVIALRQPIDATRTAELGAFYESFFPGGINVEFIWPKDPNPIQPEQAWSLVMSVWERGAGLTVSCGSGSVVAASLARQWGFVRDRSQVDMRTAPVNRANGESSQEFRYWVRTDSPPQLGVIAEQIETGIAVQLSDLREHS